MRQNQDAERIIPPHVYEQSEREGWTPEDWRAWSESEEGRQYAVQAP